MNSTKYDSYKGFRCIIINRRILVADNTDHIYSWLKIELGCDFDIHFTSCPALVCIDYILQEHHAVIINHQLWIKIKPLIKRIDTPIFMLADDFCPRTLYTEIKCGISGYFLRNESLKPLLHATINPSLRNFWVSDILKESINVELSVHKYSKLTEREREVFILLADGLGYKEIGYQLEISGKTVLAHRENLMRKMEIKTNTELIKEALKLGLIKL